MATIESALDALIQHPFHSGVGRVREVGREHLRLTMPHVQVGSICSVKTDNPNPCVVQIVSLTEEGHIAMPLDSMEGIRLGQPVVLQKNRPVIPVGNALLGNVIDSLGISYETGQRVATEQWRSVFGIQSNPLARKVITTPIDLGVRAINACVTCGLGQRQGIFAGSGVGKSVLLGMITRYTSADVVVIGLIGERGREVPEFLNNELDEEARKKCVVVIETSDRSAVRRVRGAYAATTIAEYFRDQGKNVLLLIDSVTRFAMAQREIGISAGEPPTTKAYPPSVYSSLASLLERAGYWAEKGSITGLYTVLVEGDDMEDPIADGCRAILDGHIVLSRELANRGHYPAIDILSSVSRVMDSVNDKRTVFNSRILKRVLARYRANEDAIHYGAYQPGADSEIDEAIRLYPEIERFLNQDKEERASIDDSRAQLESLFARESEDP